MSGKQIPTQKNSAVAAFFLKTVIRLSTLREPALSFYIVLSMGHFIKILI